MLLHRLFERRQSFHRRIKTLAVKDDASAKVAPLPGVHDLRFRIVDPLYK
jgi:hypothetical protein